MTVRDDIIALHAEEASFVWSVRNSAVRSPHLDLRQIGRHDDRLAAHIDALRIAAAAGWRASEVQLEGGAPGDLFCAAVLALEARDQGRISSILSLAEAMPSMRSGLLCALGWVAAGSLQGTVGVWLSSASAALRQVGIAACAMHRVDPGAALTRAIAAEEPGLRARGLRAAGECGRADLLEPCLAALRNPEPQCVFWGAWSAALLGDRGVALDALESIALAGGPFRIRALHVLVKALEPTAAHGLLTRIAQDSANLRPLLQSSGVAGDPAYIPWLIAKTEDARHARLAGESFAIMTGLDLARANLDREAPPDSGPGPNDEPDHANVAVAPDSNLAWPDRDKMTKWWENNAGHFAPGHRYFMGKAVSREVCIQVLRAGYQRQRMAAAEHLCLLNPGLTLFPTSAPAWRQQRLMGQMS